MENIFEFSSLVVLVIPVIIGLVEVLKKLGMVEKFAPLMSLLFGIGLIALTGAEWRLALVQGIIAGLAASGLFSGTKKVLKG